MMLRPVSVIVCTRNRADLVGRLIGQLRTQSYPADAYEIIVVDNGSTDHTMQVVQDISGQPGVLVHYVSENRNGVTLARNRGADVAQYPYLAYIDDDCGVEPDWLSQLVKGFDLHEKVMIVGGRVVLDWSQTARPEWLGTELEPWLAANSSLGTHPRLLDKKEQVMEGNMALKREVLQAAGGFLGMEQFGSRNMAAGEVLFLLHYVSQHEGLVAFIPEAVANHRMGVYTRKKLLHRAYWQGISDGILDYLVYKRPWLATVCSIVLDLAATIVLFGFSCFFFTIANQAKGMFNLARSTRRASLVLSKMHIVGDWHHVRQWSSSHPKYHG